MKKLYLVDVSSMFFRAFYAVRPLTSPSGLPTNAIFGFTSMIVKLLRDEKPDYLAFCYDLPTPSFRKELYPEYKAHRSETPPDLIPQIPYIKKIVNALGIPAFECEGYEADDLIGTFAELGHNEHCHVVIVSGDKDFGQLVRPGVTLYDTMKDVRLDDDGVKAKWGVRPDQFIDYLALIGDASDNIPGVEGIGPKTAEKLLGDFQNLMGVYDNLESIKSASLKEKLTKGKDLAFLSQKLVTIVKTVPVKRELTELIPKEQKHDELRELLRELNFKTFEKVLLNSSITSPSSLHDDLGIPIASNQSKIEAKKEQIEVKILERIVPNLIELSSFLDQGQDVWAFESQNSVCLVFNNKICIIESDFIEFGHLLTSKQLKYSGYDLKSFCRKMEIESPLILWDSQLAAYLIKTDHVGTFEETVSEFLLVNREAEINFDSDYHLHQLLAEKLKLQIDSHGFSKLLYEVELPLASILLKMEQNGILIDSEKLNNLSESLTLEIKNLETNIFQFVEENFNISSPKQLSVVLFEKLGLPIGKKTKTGYSTDNDVLEKLKDLHPIIPFILEYRELTKLKSTYVDAIPLLVSPSTQRVHTHYNQALTTTGRLSSTQPNLQNIPIRTERGRFIRQSFVAPTGSKLLSLDYSQIELRILAHLSDDPGLCKAFADGLDIHTATASEVFDVSLKEVTSEMRRAAKAINFGIAYGQGAYGLAENLGIGRTEAQKIISRYFIRFHRVQEYMEFTIEEAKKNGFVSTIFGRKRLLRELSSSNAMVRKFGERAAINAPVQGAASDIVKMAMIAVSKITEAKMLLQVHDELVFEVEDSKVEDLMPELIHKMENVVQLKVPLVVNGGIGLNWDAAH